MANEKHRDEESEKQIPASEAPEQPDAPANQRHSDQGKLQATYESQKTEGGTREEDRVPRGQS